MNFGELKNLVLNYIQITDTDFNQALPFMIERTQLRLRSLRVTEKEKRVFFNTSSFQIDDVEEILDIWTQSGRNPDTDEYDDIYTEIIYNHLTPISFTKYLEIRDSMNQTPPQYFARSVGTGDISRYYVTPELGDRTLTTAPETEVIVPDEVDVTYYAKQSTLVNDTDTNAYTNYYPDLMLYGAVAEGYRWLRTEDKMTYWEGMFQNMYSEIEQASFNKDYRGGTLVSSSPYAVGVSGNN